MNYQPPHRFTVSQLRVAASCPRILYFDTAYTRQRKLKAPHVTRIWESGDASNGVVTAGGKLFHDSVEAFNRLAGNAPEVRGVLQSATDSEMLLQGLLRFLNEKCLDRKSLIAKNPETIIAFRNCLNRYMQELVDMISYARDQGTPLDEITGHLFGDHRKHVDVTFYVGPQQEAVHVTGRLDYVFYDWRIQNHRIMDYKLTPSHHPKNDLFQVLTYALMHHHQHDTRPDVAVFYLHPERKMVALTWDEVYAQRHHVYDLLASMRAWVRWAPGGTEGFPPPGDLTYCQSCRWNRRGHCERELGPKDQGRRFAGWSEKSKGGAPAEPRVDVQPPRPLDDPCADVQPQRPPDDPPRSDAAVPVPAATPAASPTEPAPVESAERGTTRPAAASAGLLIGHAGNEPVLLEPRLLNTHVAVVGAAGSGKTWTAKVIVEEAIRNGIPVLAIDPQGDLVQFCRQRAREEIDSGLAARYDEFTARVEPRIFTPGSSHGERLQLSPLRLPTDEDLAHIEREERRREELESIISSAASNLVGLASIGGEHDSQRTFIFRALQSLRATHGGDVQLTAVVDAVMNPEIVGITDPDLMIKKTERTKLARKLNNLISGPAAGLFTNGRQLDLDELSKPSQPGRVPLNVIYLNAMTDDQEKQFFVAVLASEIYRWMVTSLQSEGDPNLLVYIDEARDYIPAGGSKPPAKTPLIRLFTQGRKYGVSCLLCTQSPRSVDYNVFGNCSTKIIGRLEAAQDVARVGEWFSTSGPIPVWVNARQGADRGTFVARWPQMPSHLEGRTFKSRTLFSLHEGAWSPDRLEGELG